MFSVLPVVSINNKSPLDVMLEIADNPESLSEYTKTSNIRPVVLIEDSIARMNEDVRNDILQMHLTLYSGWYLQAAIHTLKVDGVQVRELLNPLSTDPTIRNSLRISTESRKVLDSEMKLGKGLSLHDLNMEEAKGSGYKSLTDYSNLAVGKIIDVPLAIDKDEKSQYKVTVPVAVSISPRVADIDFMIDLFKYLNKDKSWVERYHQWRSGEIASISDYIFALDLIREERKLMLKDKDQMFAKAKARRAKGFLTTILSGKKAINVASTMTVITKASAMRLEATLDGGNLDKVKTREAFFEESGSMILTVVNTDRNLLTVYTRGYEQAATYTFRDIKNMGSSPNAGLDVSTVISQLARGSMPGIR